MQPSRLRSTIYDNIQKNPKCSEKKGELSRRLGGLIKAWPGIVEMLGGSDVIDIPEIYKGNWALMKISLYNGKIIGADNTILNGSCADEEAGIIYAEIRNPWIEGKIDFE